MCPPPWRAPAPVTLVVRPSFPELSGSRMSSFWKALEAWFDAQGLGFLSGFNAHQNCCTARMGSYFAALLGCLSFGSLLTTVRRSSATSHRPCGLPVLRQSAQHPGAPKCHSPSAFWPNTLGGLPPRPRVWQTLWKHQRERLCSITVHRTTARWPCAPRPLLRATA